MLNADDYEALLRAAKIKSNARDRFLCYKRYAVAHWMRSHGATLREIGECLRRDRSSINHALRQYELCYSLYGDFREIATETENICEQFLYDRKP